MSDKPMTVLFTVLMGAALAVPMWDGLAGQARRTQCSASTVTVEAYVECVYR